MAEHDSAGDLGGSGVISLWRGAGRILAPAAGRYLKGRLSRGKEDPERVGERYGIAGRDRPPGAVVWLHAASVGETQTVMPLVERLCATGVTPLLTTATLTGAAIARAHAPAAAIHQFAPLDIDGYVTAFLDHWRPGLALFVESEIWPVTLDLLYERQVPTVIVNGRMSEKSFRGWQRAGRFARPVFHRLGMVLAQSEHDAIRFRRLGVLDVVNVGNLKLNAEPLRCDDAALAALREAVGERPLWLAASTHPGEEKIVAAVHAALEAEFPGLLTLIVPRHPERGAAIARALGGGKRVALRSRTPLPGPATNIFIADTLDELGLFYRLAKVVFVGGSMVKVGGHNPIEPVRLGAAVITGPNTDNLDQIYTLLFDANAVRYVESKASLTAAVRRLLGDPDQVAAQAARGDQFLASLGDPLEQTLEYLDPTIAGILEREAREPTPGRRGPARPAAEGAASGEAAADRPAGNARTRGRRFLLARSRTASAEQRETGPATSPARESATANGVAERTGQADLAATAATAATAGVGGRAEQGAPAAATANGVAGRVERVDPVAPAERDRAADAAPSEVRSRGDAADARSTATATVTPAPAQAPAAPAAPTPGGKAAAGGIGEGVSPERAADGADPDAAVEAEAAATSALGIIREAMGDEPPPPADGGVAAETDVRPNAARKGGATPGVDPNAAETARTAPKPPASSRRLLARGCSRSRASPASPPTRR